MRRTEGRGQKTEVKAETVNRGNGARVKTEDGRQITVDREQKAEGGSKRRTGKKKRRIGETGKRQKRRLKQSPSR